MNSENTNKIAECTSNNFNLLPRGLVGKRGLPIGRGTRLPSLRGPRDLTLGGAVKRVFTPNIPQHKERIKNNEVNTSENPIKSNRNRRNRTGERVRGRGKGRGELIQTQGAVFGDGLAAISKPEGSKGTNNREHTLNKSFLSKTKLKQENEKFEEEQLLKELFVDDFIDFGNEDTKDKLYPIVLPIGSRVEAFNSNQKKKKQWQRIKVDENEEDDDEYTENNCNIILKKNNKYDKLTDEKNIEELQQATAKLFSTTNLPDPGKFLFFQFPDCLPGLTEKKDNSRCKTELDVENTTQKKGFSKKIKKSSNSSILADWPEGHLGKLQIHKSGKTCLNIGPLILDVEIGTPIRFLQDLISIRINKNSGDMTVLGHISDKVVCAPNTENLLTTCS